MSYLLDTNIVSEWVKARPEPKVVSWLVARREAKGRPIGVMDAWMAATAETRELTLVTRNTADFSGTGARCLDPFALAS